MSWLYSRALVAEYSAATCSDGAPSAQSSETPMPRAYCSPDKMTDVSRLSRFGMTFAPLTDEHGEGLLMWFREAFLARTSASQEKKQDLAEIGLGFGLKCLELLGRLDPDSCSWRTPQLSLVEAESALLQTLPRWGIAADGELWQLQMSELRTSEIASGLWPTPTAQDNIQIAGKGNAAAHPKRGTTLGGAVRLWPTPNAGSPKWGGTMQEWGGSQNWVRKEMPDLASGALNPTWVEWLMGWPLGWTDFAPLEMDRFQQWLHAHSLD